ncbi:MAG: MFS transporter [Clostridiales bacterium]|nr:MFS transporter [Clostridiales bacterium]
MSNKRYSLKSKFGYAAADVLGGGAFALTSLLFLNFLVTIEGIPAALAGIIVMVGKFWDAIIDPTLGMITDRTRSRFGRRRIFLLIGIVPVIVTFPTLWYSFGIQSLTLKFVYYIVMYLMFSTSFSIIQVPYNALLPDMVSDYEARAGYSTIRILISNIGATISVTVPPLILGPEQSRTPMSYLIMSAIFGLFYGLPILITFFSTWENPNYAESEVLKLPALLRQFGQALKNKTFLQYIGIFICAQAATDVFTAVTAFWLSDILKRSGLLTLVSGITMVVGILVLPLNNWIAKKYGKHYPAFTTLPIRIVGLAIAFFLGAQAGLPVIVLVCLLGGLGASASAFVPYTLLPDLPDTDEMITGTHGSGIYAGMATFVRTFSSGIAIFLTGVALDLFGYVESSAGQAVVQTPSALLGVRIMFSIVPILFTLAAVFLGAKYRLNKQAHAHMCAAIAFKRESGHPTTDPEQIAACEHISGMPFDQMWVGRIDAPAASASEGA